MIIALLILAALENARAPVAHFEGASSAPPLPSIVRDFAVDETSGVVYAATNAGIFRSLDQGDTWQPISRGLPDVDTQNVLVDAQRQALYAAVYGVGVFVSQDGGISWREANRGIEGRPLTTIALDPRTGALYSGTDGYGVYVSLDGGEQWTITGGGLINRYVAQLMPGLQVGELLAATDRGISRSTDAGATWEQLGAVALPTPAWALTIDPVSGTVWAATDRGILRFEPRGAHINLTHIGLSGFAARAVAFDPQSRHLYAGVLTQGVFRSSDGGVTWSPLNHNLPSIRIQTLHIGPEGNLFAGTDSGIFWLPARGMEWSAPRVAPVSRHVLALAVDQNTGQVYAGTAGGGVFRSQDSGLSWQPVSIGLGDGLVQSLTIDRGSGMIYAATSTGVYRARLDQIHWQPAGVELSGVDVASVVADVRSGYVFALTERGDVFRSIDQGASWQQVEQARYLFARTMAVSQYAGALYIGAFRGGVAQSLDQGFHWEMIGRTLPDPDIEALAVDQHTGVLYAGALGGSIFRTQDSGATWQRVGEPLPDRVLALLFDEQSDSLWVATSAGLFRSDTHRDSWQPMSDGLSHSYILTLATHRESGVVYAGTRAGGAFRLLPGQSVWQPIHAGLSDATVSGLVVGSTASELWVAASRGGVFHTTDAGQTWRVLNAGLPDDSVRSMAAGVDGSLWTVTASGLFRFESKEGAWRPADRTLAPWIGLIWPASNYGLVGRVSGEGVIGPSQGVWAAVGGGSAWAQLASPLGLARATAPTAGGEQRHVWSAWAAHIAQSSSEIGYARVPLIWMWLRAWVSHAEAWTRVHAPGWWIAGLFCGGVVLCVGLILRLRLAARFGTPLVTSLVHPQQMPACADPRVLSQAWPSWEKDIKTQLYRYGDACPVDLRRIPSPFRRWALQRYRAVYGAEQPLKMDADRLRLDSSQRVRAWLCEWMALSRELKGQRFRWLKRERADTLARILADALRARVLPPLDVESVRAYGVLCHRETPSPVPSFALLLVSDPEPSAGTLRHLKAALGKVGDVLACHDANPRDPIAVVVPLGQSGAQRDVAATLQRILVQTEWAARMMILNGDHVLDILAAHAPAESLRRRMADVLTLPAAAQQSA
ncbi:MAG: hypothetical protein RMN25_06545 [Anaerolineae bacterium]|nr:hypothetical protein [Thermoflexales bacterium]MDW8407428.1 hypothetical protein [Anaerolineae bacterium]